MNKQMLNMEELEQVNGGNFLTDAWEWLCEKVSKANQTNTGVKPITRDYPNFMVK